MSVLVNEWIDSKNKIKNVRSYNIFTDSSFYTTAQNAFEVVTYKILAFVEQVTSNTFFFGGEKLNFQLERRLHFIKHATVMKSVGESGLFTRRKVVHATTTTFRNWSNAKATLAYAFYNSFMLIDIALIRICVRFMLSLSLLGKTPLY